MDALADASQPVPEAAIRKLRDLELDDAIQECMRGPGPHAPHRHAHDPSVKRPGTPTTSRKFVSAVVSYQLHTNHVPLAIPSVSAQVLPFKCSGAIVCILHS